MPELPEVQTVINGLNNKILNKEILEIKEFRAGTVVWHIPATTLGKVKEINRRGKYIILQTSKKYKLVIHLRMTGKLIFETDLNKTAKHGRAEIVFSDKTKLIFNDIRTFGKIQILNEKDQVEAFTRLGVEPLSDEFDEKYLKAKLANRKAPIKNLLLDQSVIAGLGNIYVAEILFRSKINPTKQSKKLTRKQIKEIVQNTKKVLQQAIKHNGTTISDYRSVEDKTGEFQNFLKVYGKEFCECGAEISKIKQAGRSTYFCKKCQI
ncbi:MAG: bifunctional DNA-formamidopyrimidine glycosylase/DNA-(apurinic or apyrimidinic site) lyase [Candidatus Cloacimonetes bacterium]|nr:bifunctional DNA-formamidopyrimidine glycosylase/DNA-(apurinic or apyrimidinic site) lyase [Candidatus Cloacimonadota bacterium]MCF7867240.1 bifunctional DNA-formamidopyrimidine glycosylase/DNA-(apurinic or apyrimidinic site) lyase [Candidatus Cloacimonadota bacterium]MCF7882684.1 bifunctional DNA-formamidopyrimidine glycosylase/DNA-(apurinic or apyrimidinic site) lyase [Candidatus Cloacimonadota bacterium]